MKKFLSIATILSLLIMPSTLLAGWSPHDKENPQNQEVENPEVAAAIAKFKNKDPQLIEFFNQTHAYAIFPTVGKGGFGIGGAYGKGEVYRDNKLISHNNIANKALHLTSGTASFFFFAKRNLL